MRECALGDSFFLGYNSYPLKNLEQMLLRLNLGFCPNDPPDWPTLFKYAAIYLYFYGH